MPGGRPAWRPTSTACWPTTNEEALIAVLDQLYGAESRAYDELADMVESPAPKRAARRTRRARRGHVCRPRAGLVALPDSLGPDPRAPGRRPARALQAHVLAAEARLALADVLFSPDQLPQNYVETAQLAEKLAKAAIHGRNLKIDPTSLRKP
jgi:hypothetical protein